MKLVYIVAVPVILVLLLMAYVPGLRSSTFFFILAIFAIQGGLVFALWKRSQNDEEK
jgi:hypothetical protein